MSATDQILTSLPSTCFRLHVDTAGARQSEMTFGVFDRTDEQTRNVIKKTRLLQDDKMQTPLVSSTKN